MTSIIIIDIGISICFPEIGIRVDPTIQYGLMVQILVGICIAIRAFGNTSRANRAALPVQATVVEWDVPTADSRD